MITPKEGLFDRVEQSFNLFVKFFKWLLLPVFLYYFLFWALYSFLSTSFYVWYLGDEFFISFFSQLSNLNQSDWNTVTDLLTYIFWNSKIVFLWYFSMLIWLIIALLFIPIKLGLIRWIKQWFNDENINIAENFKYGFDNFISSFKTYWYIFAYVYLIPALVFIVLSLLLIILLKNESLMNEYSSSLIIIGVFSWLFFLWFIIYRSLQAKFALFSAVDNDSFTEGDFKKSLKPTKNNLIRIFGNLLVFWIILSIASSFVWWIFNLIVSIFWATSNMDSIFSKIDINLLNNSQEILNYLSNIDIKELTSFNIFAFISKAWWNLITAIWEIIMTIFIYIFYKRLVFEKKDDIKKEL